MHPRRSPCRGERRDNAIADAVVVDGVIGIEEGATHGIATMSLAHHADKEIFQANKERWRSLH